MNNIAEALVEEYFLKKGFKVSRNTQFSSKSNLIRDKKGTSDFLLTTKKGSKIYLEVKGEQTPYLNESQINFIKETLFNKKRFWIVIVSRLGAFIIFELKKEFKLKIIDHGFFKLQNESFYFLKNKIKLFDFRHNKKMELENHIEQLRKLRKETK